VPHIHFDSSSEKNHHVMAHSSHDHDHTHHHIHDGNEEKVNWLESILGLLGAIHHTDLGDDHFENFTPQSTSFNISSFNLNAITFDPVCLVSYNLVEQDNAQNLIEHPKILYEQHYTCSSPLRGPPAIS